MPLNNKTTNYRSDRIVALGYGFLLLLTLLSSAFSYSLGNNIQQITDQLQVTRQQQTNVDEMIQGARNRSILLLRMITTNDAFLMDDILREMDTEASKIIVARQTFAKTLTDKNDRALLDQLLAVTTQNRKNQDYVYDIMIMQNKPEAARQFLVDVTLPVQDKALQILKTFQNTLHLQAEHNEQQMHRYLKNNKILWVAILFIFTLSLLVISLFTLKRLRQWDKIQSHFKQLLEDKVEQRTMELHLDSSVLHNIHEAVAVANCSGELIKTNPQFDKFLEEANIQSDNVWTILNKILPNLSIDETQCCLLEKGFSRYEAEMKIAQRTHHYFVDVFCVNDEQLAQRYLSLLLTDVSELKNTQQHLQKIANFDTVTQLPNRHFFQTHLQQAIDNHAVRNFSLFYIDLDNFKWINDTLGHSSGDDFLREIAKLLEQTFINDDHILVSRLGGDEFAILVESDDDNSLVHIADQILKSCKEVNDINHYSKSVGCSIGVASYPKDGKNQEDLMRHADFAMYKAKEQGKNQYCFFSDAMNQRIHYLYDMEKNLQTAIEEEQLFMHFQPQFNLQNGQLTGAEALVRWQHQGQHISPAEFIPLAEQFGLIHAIGSFVMRTSLEQLALWQAQGHHLPKIAVNASSAQISLHNFAQKIDSILTETQILPIQLDIEITETVLMENLKHQKNALQALQKQSVEISIDDFGTGYSSLAYIKHLSVDRIKIDQSFINDLGQSEESDSIVFAIITMGHSLGLKVLAEGIETAEQLKRLREMGCDEGQGYLLGRPVAKEIFSFVALDLKTLAQ